MKSTSIGKVFYIEKMAQIKVDLACMYVATVLLLIYSYLRTPDMHLLLIVLPENLLFVHALYCMIMHIYHFCVLHHPEIPVADILIHYWYLHDTDIISRKAKLYATDIRCYAYFEKKKF